MKTKEEEIIIDTRVYICMHTHMHTNLYLYNVDVDSVCVYFLLILQETQEG